MLKVNEEGEEGDDTALRLSTVTMTDWNSALGCPCYLLESWPRNAVVIRCALTSRSVTTLWASQRHIRTHA